MKKQERVSTVTWAGVFVAVFAYLFSAWYGEAQREAEALSDHKANIPFAKTYTSSDMLDSVTTWEK